MKGYNIYLLVFANKRGYFYLIKVHIEEDNRKLACYLFFTWQINNSMDPLLAWSELDWIINRDNRQAE